MRAVCACVGEPPLADTTLYAVTHTCACTTQCDRCLRVCWCIIYLFVAAPVSTLLLLLLSFNPVQGFWGGKWYPPPSVGLLFFHELVTASCVNGPAFAGMFSLQLARMEEGRHRVDGCAAVPGTDYFRILFGQTTPSYHLCWGKLVSRNEQE